MMEKVETVLVFGIIACFAFSLGWYMRGDVIYSGMFEHTVSMMPKIK